MPSSIQPPGSASQRNPAQLEAVDSILHLNSGAAPFIVFGPPGTGKTVTIVEAIQQILHLYPQARVVACAPSNNAADILSHRLMTLPPEQREAEAAADSEGGPGGAVQ